ncbi:hypothetical protein [Synechococcus sp. RSCCF101]|uniref:hypothetical protein n=1 Tax=Synechococcus sp. RSCCF101 TaxID=2511069 RepID=UPI001244D969|nr:hypothetical protein [Synechococcus sp. RSCCF101]
MVLRRLFQRQGAFFLNLEGGDTPDSKAATPKATVVSPTREETTPEPEAPAAEPAGTTPAPAPPAGTAPTAAAPAEVAAPAEPAPMTTAEALRLEAIERPEPVLATFAPECLAPSAALPRRRRTGGANLSGFKAMAKELGKGS